ncbi:MAG TPA: substrate-binding domain-containing protein, partial [Polyangiaceae bacterium]
MATSNIGNRRIGVLAPFLGGYYYGAVLAGLLRSAAARAVQVVAIQTKGTDLCWATWPKSAPLAIDAVDGFIAVNDFDSREVLAAISEHRLPLVCIGFKPEGIDCCSVLADNRAGAKSAAMHLIAHGHRRIGFVGYFEHLDIRERYAGYLDAHADAGIDVDPELLFPSTNNMELDGREVGRLLTRGGLPCTALMTGTDKNALGVLYAMQEAGHRVPEDLAIVGFDDIDASQYAAPPLSTVRQRFDVLGETAAELLLDRLEKTNARPDVVRVPAVFVARASCGC